MSKEREYALIRAGRLSILAPTVGTAPGSPHLSDEDCAAILTVVDQEHPLKVTNRERSIYRASTRNSYELSEAEVDAAIEEITESEDVDQAHEDQLEKERGWAEEQPDDEQGLADLYDEGDATPEDPEV